MGETTPGPWQAVFEDDPRGQPVPYYRGLVCIIADGDKRISVVAERDCTAEEWAANARLIAAAPELLAACRLAVFRPADPKPGELVDLAARTRDALHAAIAKAGAQ